VLAEPVPLRARTERRARSAPVAVNSAAPGLLLRRVGSCSRLAGVRWALAGKRAPAAEARRALVDGPAQAAQARAALAARKPVGMLLLQARQLAPVPPRRVAGRPLEPAAMLALCRRAGLLGRVPPAAWLVAARPSPPVPASPTRAPIQWSSQRGHGPQPKPGTLSGVRANRAAR
jgi:hypothetical protein